MDKEMAWYTLVAGVEEYTIKLRLYGPKEMRMTDVVFEQMPGKVKWYQLAEEGDER